jgi:hypothetical protein
MFRHVSAGSRYFCFSFADAERSPDFYLADFVTQLVQIVE